MEFTVLGFKISGLRGLVYVSLVRKEILHHLDTLSYCNSQDPEYRSALGAAKMPSHQDMQIFLQDDRPYDYGQSIRLDTGVDETRPWEFLIEAPCK